MSIVAVHGPNTFGSKAVSEVGPAIASVTPPANDGLKWTFRLDQPSTRTASLVWTFPTGTPASATGPGPHAVTFASAGTKAVTAVATGAGEGANPYPPAGTTNIPVTAVSGAAPALLMAGAPPDEEEITAAGDEDDEDDETEEVIEEEEEGFDPADYTVAEIEEFIDANPEEAQVTLDKERAGKNRTTLVAYLEARVAAQEA